MKRRQTSSFLGAAAVAAAMWAGASAAAALPLAPEACDRAREEQETLNALGVADDVARGGDWGRTNLDRARLAQVARWIELQENLLFKCPRKPLVAKAGPETDGTPSSEQKPSPAKPSAKPATKPATKPAPARDDAQAAPGEASPAQKAVKPASQAAGPAQTEEKKSKPRPKPRVDDAYVPPAPYSGHDVQHATPGNPASELPWSSLAP